MSEGFRARGRRVGLVAVALVTVLTLAGPSQSAFAQTAPMLANFSETTTFVACASTGVPAGALCFVGVGYGTYVPTGDTNAVERFAGYVVPTTGMDANVVSITTKGSTLFLTTQGQAVGLTTESGVWTAHGGTGIFQGATGTGSVTTTSTGQSGNTITSNTTYFGVVATH